MKKLFTLLAGLCFLTSALATSVYFPALEMTGSTNDITINVRAVNNPIIWNNQFYYLPANGTNLTTTDGVVTNSFVPGQYDMAFPGLGQSWRIYVTNSASAVSAVALSRGITIYSGIQTLSASGLQLTNDGYGNFYLAATNSGGSDPNALTNNDSRTISLPAASVLSATNAADGNPLASFDLTYLMNPRRVGVGHGATAWDGYQRTNGFCFYLPAGKEGVIRTISFQTTDGLANSGYTRRDKIRLRVFCDAGNISSTTPNSGYMTVNVPIGTLCSDTFRYASNGAYLCRRSTELLDVVSGTNDLNTSTIHFRLKTPMMFTNGVAIGFWDDDANAPFTNGYFSTAYDLGTNNRAFSDYRFNARSYATNAAGTPMASVLTLFAITNKFGLAVGWNEAWSWVIPPADVGDNNSANEAFSLMGEIPIIFQTGGESDTNASINKFTAYYDYGAGSAWISSGKDDFFHNSYAFTNAREWDGYDVGTPHRTLTGYNPTTGYYQVAIQESYRWLIHDTFTFSNRLTIVAAHVPDQTNFQYRAMIMTYEK